MEAKEKAEDLLNKYLDTEGTYEYISYSMAKKCALIAVDEILLACALETKGKFEYYLEVKQEINNL